MRRVGKRTSLRKLVLRPAVYLFTTWNTHPCFPDPADDYRAAFSIILVGNQIADSVRLTIGTTKRAVARRSSTLVWSIGLGIDGLGFGVST